MSRPGCWRSPRTSWPWRSAARTCGGPPPRPRSPGRATRSKSALLDAVSHDLRTPLASIRAAAGTLVDPELPPTAADALAAGTVIELEATRLDRLVRDVLDLSRIEGGGLRPALEALDLRDVVEPVVERLRPALGERSVSIDVADDLPPVAADAVLLDAVISNLVENAARHAPPPAAVAIAARPHDGAIELSVDDAGPGVPAEDLDRLFDKFFRLDRAGGGSRRGMGIGLTVVRGLTEAMGGRVAAESSPLGGLADRRRPAGGRRSAQHRGLT